MIQQPLPEPRRLTPEDVEAFKKAFAENWGEELSVADATNLAGKLLELYRRLAELARPASKPPKSSEEPKELKQGTLF